MKKIEVAEDEDSIRILIEGTLEGAECEIVQARNGRAALEIARRERPDLILMEWMMPGLSGMEVLKALRTDPSTARIPVIMLTAMGQEKDRNIGKEAGALYYLSKPFNALELLQKVQEVLARNLHKQEDR